MERTPSWILTPAERRRRETEDGERDFLQKNPTHPQKNGRPICFDCRKRIAAYLGGTGQAYCRKCSSSR